MKLKTDEEITEKLNSMTQKNTMCGFTLSRFLSYKGLILYQNKPVEYEEWENHYLKQEDTLSELKKSLERDLNPRPNAYEAFALPG